MEFVSNERYSYALSSYVCIYIFVVIVANLQDHFFLYDTATANATAVPTATFTAMDSFVSGAAVCNGVYYGAFGDFNDQTWGLGGVDIATGVSTSLDTIGLPHAVFCDPTSDGALIVLESRAGTPMAEFRLQRYAIDGGDEETLFTVPQNKKNLFLGMMI